jgi:hypothetical protein
VLDTVGGATKTLVDKIEIILTTLEVIFKWKKINNNNKTKKISASGRLRRNKEKM